MLFLLPLTQLIVYIYIYLFSGSTVDEGGKGGAKYQDESEKYSCDQCEYSAGKRINLKQHKEKEHEGRRYTCNQCEYSACSRSHLRHHKKVKHEGMRYLCDQCKYAATTSSDLKRHKEVKHEGIRYPCDQCEYSAGQLAHLKEHMKRKHEGIAYQCDRCLYLANTLQHLKMHKENKHEGIAYPCDDIFSGNRRTKKQYCSVIGCESPRDQTYHRYPTDPIIAKQWVIFSGMKTVCKTARICGKHFDQSAFKNKLKEELLNTSMRKILHKTAVPTLHIPAVKTISHAAEKLEHKRIISELMEVDHDNHEEAIEPVENGRCTENSTVQVPTECYQF